MTVHAVDVPLQPASVILPLVMRHAEDAAFYWMQRDANAYSPLLRFDRLAHFDRLLDAHLDGLRVAGEPGWELALKNLKRWRTNGESFTAYVLMLESGNTDKLDTLWSLVKSCPDTTYSGLISALGWVGANVALPWLEHWLERSDFASLQMIALRGYAIRRIAPKTPLDGFFRSEHGFLRTAACMLAGRVRLYAYRPHLHALRQDADAEVRIAAAMALHLQGESAAVATDLWHGLLHLNQRSADLKGLVQKLAAGRANLLASHLGHALPVNHFDWKQVAQWLPPRQVLTLFAHHGDPALIPFIIHFAATPELNRLAGWALGMVTDIDPDAAGLSAAPPEPAAEEDERSTPLSDPDVGLPWMNPAALRDWWLARRSHYRAGQRLLLGEPQQDKDFCLEVLDEGTQAQRFAASINLAMADPALALFETRAAATVQQRWLQQMDGALVA